MIRIRPDFSLEQTAIDSGALRVAGVDEVGRGPLAGPVTAAAVILDPRRIPDGIDDSKKLSERARTDLAARIKDCAVWAIAHGLADLLAAGRLKPILALRGAARDAALAGIISRALPPDSAQADSAE